MISLLEEIAEAVVKAESGEEVKELTQRAINEGYQAREIMNSGLIKGMNDAGEKWASGEFFIPEVLHSAEKTRAGMEILRELIVKDDIKPIGKVIIGTVKGDVHNIGKSLVAMMLESAGFEVHDLGVDVAVEKFVEVVKAQRPDLLALSALLTTTMPAMLDTIQAIKEEGLKVNTIIGGSPTTQEYADSIGASGYAPDAISAVAKAKELLGYRKRGKRQMTKG
jgi:5-methyltetrahydrofolate--homocysteine methyltransferase